MFIRRATSRSKGALAALILPLVLLASPAFSGMLLYICSVDGQARLSCCCPQKNGNSSGASISAVSKSCCQMRTIERTPAGAVSSVAAGTGAPLSVLTTTSALDRAPSPAPRMEAVSWRGPPHGAPLPLFVRNCSFLI